MATSIPLLSFVVNDYDEAIAFFTGALRFSLIEDQAMTPGKRWVVVAPRSAGSGAALLLAKASSDDERAHVGNQTGGRVFLFLNTDDFDDDYAHMQAHGVRFAEMPRDEAYGRVAVFFDLYGNKWDLLQRKAG